MGEIGGGLENKKKTTRLLAKVIGLPEKRVP